MKPVNFDYARPKDVDASLSLLAEDGRSVKVVAGSQSLGPMLNMRLVQPDLLVDITGVDELRQVKEEADGVVIGACVTHSDIEDRRVPDVTGGALPSVARGIAYRAVRNRGTIGGSLTHADPSADWISILAALGASVTLRGPHGVRTIPVEDYMLGALEADLRPGELLVSVKTPRLGRSARWGYHKICRKTGEFAQAIGAFVVDPERGVCRAVIGATETRPIIIADARRIIGDGAPGHFDSRADRRVGERSRHERSAGTPDACRRPSARRGAGCILMTKVSLTVNGSVLSAEVEPRTHLADLLRETHNLTGTHIGCEHGVCGACTLLVDGVPIRSCITFAVACENAKVTTIEGLDEDEIARELRAAFTAHHALQCGYCTPGMIVSARDIVLRMEAPTEQDIRVAMSGNLCRCTGYVGIVRAVQTVLSDRRTRGVEAVPGGGRELLGPAGSGRAGEIRAVTAAAVALPRVRAAPRFAPAGAAARPEADWKPQARVPAELRHRPPCRRSVGLLRSRRRCRRVSARRVARWRREGRRSQWQDEGQGWPNLGRVQRRCADHAR